MEPDVITSGAQGKVVWLELEIELTNKVLDLQDESGYRPWFQIREQGGEGYWLGGAFARCGWEGGGGGRLQAVQNGHTCWREEKEQQDV